MHGGASQAGSVEQRVELLDRALLARARHEHDHIRQCGMWIRLVDDHVDNGDSASMSDRVPAFLKDLDALLVRPVVQDELEQQQIPCRDGLEEAPADSAGAVREAVARDFGFGVFDDIGPVENDSAQRGVLVLK